MTAAKLDRERAARLVIDRQEAFRKAILGEAGGDPFKAVQKLVLELAP